MTPQCGLQPGPLPKVTFPNRAPSQGSSRQSDLSPRWPGSPSPAATAPNRASSLPTTRLPHTHSSGNPVRSALKIRPESDTSHPSPIQPLAPPQGPHLACAPASWTPLSKQWPEGGGRRSHHVPPHPSPAQALPGAPHCTRKKNPCLALASSLICPASLASLLVLTPSLLSLEQTVCLEPSCPDTHMAVSLASFRSELPCQLLSEALTSPPRPPTQIGHAYPELPMLSRLPAPPNTHHHTTRSVSLTRLF